MAQPSKETVTGNMRSLATDPRVILTDSDPHSSARAFMSRIRTHFYPFRSFSFSFTWARLTCVYRTVVWIAGVPLIVTCPR